MKKNTPFLFRSSLLLAFSLLLFIKPALAQEGSSPTAAKQTKNAAYRIHKTKRQFLIEKKSTQNIAFRFNHKNVGAKSPSKIIMIVRNYIVLSSKSVKTSAHLSVYSLRTKRKVFKHLIESEFIPTRFGKGTAKNFAPTHFNKKTGQLKFWADLTFPASCPIKSQKDLKKKFKFCWGLLQLKAKAFRSTPRPNLVYRCIHSTPWVTAQFSINLYQPMLNLKSTGKFRARCE